MIGSFFLPHCWYTKKFTGSFRNFLWNSVCYERELWRGFLEPHLLARELKAPMSLFLSDVPQVIIYTQERNYKSFLMKEIKNLIISGIKWDSLTQTIRESLQRIRKQNWKSERNALVSYFKFLNTSREFGTPQLFLGLVFLSISIILS